MTAREMAVTAPGGTRGAGSRLPRPMQARQRPGRQAFFSMFQKNCTGESTMPVRLLRKAMGC